MDLFKEYTLLLNGPMIDERGSPIDTALPLYTNKRGTTIHFIGSLSDFHIFKGYCTTQGYTGDYHYSPNLNTFISTYIYNDYRHFFSTPSYIEEYLSLIDI